MLVNYTELCHSFPTVHYLKGVLWNLFFICWPYQQTDGLDVQWLYYALNH